MDLRQESWGVRRLGARDLKVVFLLFSRHTEEEPGAIANFAMAWKVEAIAWKGVAIALKEIAIAWEVVATAWKGEAIAKEMEEAKMKVAGVTPLKGGRLMRMDICLGSIVDVASGAEEAVALQTLSAVWADRVRVLRDSRFRL